MTRHTSNAHPRRRQYVALAVLAAACAGLATGVLVTADDRSRVAWAASLDRGYDGPLRRAEGTECGPAALAMVMEHHGIDVPIAALAREAGTGASGTSLLKLKHTAQRRGFRAEGWRMSFADLREIELPAVAHVHGDHFVVVRSLGRRVVVDDPSLGRLRMSHRTFRRAWDGVVLTLTSAARRTSPTAHPAEEIR